MNPLKKLAGQTAVYGLSSIIGRFLNYLLTPLYTSKNVFDPEQYGIITEMYAYVALLIIVLTYGMETAFFRYSNTEGVNKGNAFTTAVYSLGATALTFILVAIVFSQPIGDFLRYPDHHEYVIWFAFIVGLDAVSTIPLAKLRLDNRPLRFALVNLSSVAVNIGLNLFFLAYCMPQYGAGNSNFLIDTFYNPEIGVGYVFIANLIASIVKFALLSPYLRQATTGFSKVLLKSMLKYSWPLLLVGLGWYINENFDRILLKWMLYDKLGEVKTMEQVGIYGANYKLSIIIILFIQAFRYAAEPFFFSRQKDNDARKTYAKILNYFVGTVCTIFLTVMLFIDIFKYFIPNEIYHVGIGIVPILLAANIFQGIHFNLSFWYKLTNKTIYGAALAFVGAIITLVINILFIPEYGYMACAWATFSAYGAIMVISYFLGQRHYPIPYKIPRLLFYISITAGLYFLSALILPKEFNGKYLVYTFEIALFVFIFWKIEKPRRQKIKLAQ